MTTIDGFTSVNSDEHDHVLAPRECVRDFVADVHDNLPCYLPSLVAIGFGLVLSLPADTFGTAVSFGFMAKLSRLAGLGATPELPWGVLFLAIGCWHVAWMFLRHHNCYIARAAVTAAWVFVVVLFAVSYLATTGIVAYAGYAWLAHWGRDRARPRH
jgi:hypothetical protein